MFNEIKGKQVRTPKEEHEETPLFVESEIRQILLQARRLQRGQKLKLDMSPEPSSYNAVRLQRDVFRVVDERGG